MSSLPALPSVEEGDFNAEGSYIGPADAIDDILGDIVDGKSARSKIDAVKRRGNSKVVRLPSKQSRQPVKRSAFDAAAAELIEEARTPAVLARRRDADKLLDRYVDNILGPDEGKAPQSAFSSSSRKEDAASFSQEEVSAGVRRGQLIAAADAEWQAANALAAQFHQYVQAVASEFPGVETENDIRALAMRDPVAYVRFNAYREEVQKYLSAVVAQGQHADAVRQAAFNECAAYEDAQFRKKNPGWSEADEADLLNMLLDYGVSGTELSALYSTALPVNLGDPRALRILEDACRHHLGKDMQHKSEIFPALVDTFIAAGFSEQEIGSFAHGAPAHLRDHRLQQLLVWALEWKRGRA